MLSLNWFKPQSGLNLSLVNERQPSDLHTYPTIWSQKRWESSIWQAGPLGSRPPNRSPQENSREDIALKFTAAAPQAFYRWNTSADTVALLCWEQFPIVPWPGAKCHVCLHVAAVDKQKHFDIDINQRLCGCKIKREGWMVQGNGYAVGWGG